MKTMPITFASVPRLFPNETIVCLATGPSLTPADVHFVKGKARVIAINNAYKLAPWADVLFASDAHWWGWHRGVPDFHGLKYCLRPGAQKWGVHILKDTGPEGLETDPGAVKHGNNSGYAAVNCAVHLGASRIVLLGYDMQRGPKYEAHFPGGDHPQKNNRDHYDNWRKMYLLLVDPLRKRQIEVINCTRRTALTAFPRQPLEHVFASMAVSA